MKQVRLMIVEDSLTIRAIIESICERADDCQVVGFANDAEAARALMPDCLPNVIALDLNLPGVDGLEFLAELAAIPHAPVIVVSSSTTRGSKIIAEAQKLGAVGCFDKAFLVQEADRLVRLLRKAAAKARVRGDAERADAVQPSEEAAERPAVELTASA